LSIAGPLVDSCGRVHTDLRISVTDRCNIRCRYCMPAGDVKFQPRGEILSFEEIERFVEVAAGLGIRKVRLTGGEPLVRSDLPRLVQMLAAVPGIADLAMTTNGVLLARHAAALKAAGLKRLNVSLDTLDPERFRQITGCDALAAVLEGIAAARRAGFQQVKLNSLAIRGFSEEEVVPLALFARQHDLQLRFIEFMPLDADRRWSSERVLPGDEILRLLSRGIGPLEPVRAKSVHAPAAEYRFLDGGGCVGLIRCVTKPFCDQCNRLRLTADGKLRNCLFSARQWDVRAVLRGGGSRRRLAELICLAVGAKRRAHGTDKGELLCCDRPMHQIGG
jgi:cyclic pyranopterin phosphate synthase